MSKQRRRILKSHLLNVCFVFKLRPARFWLPVRRPQLMPISWTTTPIILLICVLPLLFLFTVDVLLKNARCLVLATVPHSKASSAGSHRYANTKITNLRKCFLNAKWKIHGLGFIMIVPYFFRWLRLAKMSLDYVWASYSSVKMKLKKQRYQSK